MLCLPLIYPVLNEGRVSQSFPFCVVLCFSLISPVLNEETQHHTERKRLSNTHLIKNRGYQGKTQHHTESKRLSTHTSFRTGDIRGKHNTLNRLLSVWCCVYPWYPRFLMRCVFLNRLLSVWCCAYPWYPRFLMRCVLLNRLLSPHSELGISEVSTTPHRKQTIE
jgi:hypothetical protein